MFKKKTQKPQGSPEEVIEAILKRGIKWYDYKELDFASQLSYYNNAVLARNNEVLVNEVKHALSDLVTHIANKSQNFEEVRDLRMTMNGMQLILDRLESIEKPKDEIKETNPFEGL